MNTATGLGLDSSHYAKNGVQHPAVHDRVIECGKAIANSQSPWANSLVIKASVLLSIHDLVENDLGLFDYFF